MIRYSTEANSPVVELMVEGVVTNADLAANMDRLRQDLEQNGKTRLIEIISNFHGMEPAAFWTDLTRAPALASKLTRVAVVADKAWMRAMTGVAPLFTRAEVKAFAPEQLGEARSWIAAP
jgi:FAD/FMN-containing dehydrogenase